MSKYYMFIGDFAADIGKKNQRFVVKVEAVNKVASFMKGNVVARNNGACYELGHEADWVNPFYMLENGWYITFTPVDEDFARNNFDEVNFG